MWATPVSSGCGRWGLVGVDEQVLIEYEKTQKDNIKDYVCMNEESNHIRDISQLQYLYLYIQYRVQNQGG